MSRKNVIDIAQLKRARIQAQAAKLAGRTPAGIDPFKADQISLGTEGDKIKLYWTKAANQIGFNAQQARFLAARLVALADELEDKTPPKVSA